MAAAIPLAISGISSLIGGGIASSGAQSAANTQSQSVDKGIAAIQAGQNQVLPVMQNMYNQGVSGYQPYQQAGTAASSRLSTLMGLSPTQSAQGTSFPTNAPNAYPTNAGGSGGQSGGMVTLQGPDGSIVQKPQAELQHWLSKGATVVGGGGGGSQTTPTPKAW